MSEIIELDSFPFNSLEVIDENGEKTYDREYPAERFEDYFAKFLSSGVFFGHYKGYGDNAMKVKLDSGMTVKIQAGAGCIRGKDFVHKTDTIANLERPLTGERIDRIVVRADNTLDVRKTTLCIKKGENGQVATLERNTDVYEICLAEITVKATANLAEQDIVDTRLDNKLCGVVTSLIDINGEEIYNNFNQKVDDKLENLVEKDKENTLKEKLIAEKGVYGDVKGNVEGNVTGDLTGNVTGNVSGNARNS